ncbi:MAG: bifunctional oligoribonuclease/PAP phosphatase NrnA [Verrucomicrobiota bacterium]
MISADSLAALRKLCDQRDRFLVISHVRPDGDAYGSTLGLALSLREQGKEVLVVNQDGLSPLFTFLPGAAGLAAKPPVALEPDRVLIAVDCADGKRLGAVFDQWQRPPDVNIDHHISNPGYGRLNLVDADQPATAQVLYEIITGLGWPLTAGVATNLYVGLMTDTGSFRYRQTTARTFEVAAALVAAGADPTDLAEACYQSYRPQRLLLLCEVLRGIHFRQPRPRGLVRPHPRDVRAHRRAAGGKRGSDREPAGGEDRRGRLPDGVDGRWLTRVSMRSRGTVDVNKICHEFGGGGHRLAAGLRTKLPPRPSWKRSCSASSPNNCRNDQELTTKNTKVTKGEMPLFCVLCDLCGH